MEKHIEEHHQGSKTSFRLLSGFEVIEIEDHEIWVFFHGVYTLLFRSQPLSFDTFSVLFSFSEPPIWFPS